MGNLAARLWARGELREPVGLWKEAEREAEQYGQKGFARWFRAVLAGPEYELGDWDACAARTDDFLAEVEAGSPHYLAAQCYLWRALIRLARGEREGSIADAERGLELGRRAKDPQAMYPACATSAHVLMEVGEPERALPPAEEFLSAVVGGSEIGFADTVLHMLSWTLTEVGRGEECASALENYARFPWARVGIAVGRGDPVQAADLCAEIGAVASEAYCRLSAARMGDLAQLERALAFYRLVGATRYIRECELLLPATA
jgi:hypothetical protein